jgi:hypothetical protein
MQLLCALRLCPRNLCGIRIIRSRSERIACALRLSNCSLVLSTFRPGALFLLCLQIASWLAARALQLDAATGQLPEALQLLELAVDKGYGQFQVSFSPT